MSHKSIDPLKLLKMVWPDVVLYDKQIEILYSVRDNDETFVPAGNQLGKDFIAAYAALWFFISRRPARVVTTSVKYDQLSDVLWGEIRRFLATATVRLPIQYNHLHIRQVDNHGCFIPRAELVGQVSNKNEGLLGRHLERGPFGEPRTLAIFDEASGIDDGVYKSTETWAHRKLVIGNPFPCTNFFFSGVKAGDLKAPDEDRYYRKVIKITADDSPNVKLARAQIGAGETPTKETLVPGVKSYDDLKKHRLLWDSMLQCIGLDAEFYEGAEVKLFPVEWLLRAEELADELIGVKRTAKTIGVDPAEGGDKTSWCVADELGVINLISMKTPDTSTITSHTIALMREYRVSPENVLFDRGGGGKQHADRLRQQGYKVRTVAFGESVKSENTHKRMKTSAEKKREEEERYIYKNRRAEMYGLTRLKLSPSNTKGFAIHREFMKILRPQLSPIPLQYDGEGRMKLPPKNKNNPNSTEVTLVDMIGHSPDEADSLALSVFGLENKGKRRIAGAISLNA